MAQYEVLHAYRSTRDGQQFGPWKPGDFVELTEVDADWVNRDSPGCLKAALAEPKPEPERQKPAGPNRQHRGGANRSSS